MILVDANLLLYATLQESRDHEAANRWLSQRLEGREQVGLPWASLLAFVRIVTHPTVSQRPLSILSAWSQVEAWLSHESAWIPGATERHAGILRELLQTRGLRPDDVQDAHLAATALEHGLTLCSCDAGFARFSALKWLDPLK